MIVGEDYLNMACLNDLWCVATMNFHDAHLICVLLKHGCDMIDSSLSRRSEIWPFESLIAWSTITSTSVLRNIFWPWLSQTIQLCRPLRPRDLSQTSRLAMFAKNLHGTCAPCAHASITVQGNVRRETGKVIKRTVYWVAMFGNSRRMMVTGLNLRSYSR